MRINNNIMAMNTHRQYTINTNSLSKNMEKLSSGYRVNRAGDDAAGLAISEKMRSQIRGLRMASKNSSDAISLVQTAEGALQESHNIIQRMRELAVQSSSDTNETTIDRAALNAEFQQLKNEIADTAKKAKFNDMGVIDGSYSGTMGAFTPALAQSGVITAGVGMTSDGTAWTYNLKVEKTTDNTFKLTLTDPDANIVSTLELTNEQIYELDLYEVGLEARFQLNDGTAIRFKLAAADVITSADKTGTGAVDKMVTAITTVLGAANTDIVWTGKPITIQTGANQGDELQLTIAAMDAEILGIDTLSIATGEAARRAITRMNDAANFISTQRAALGAMQNRLVHKINNLDTSAENLSAAESRIRDLDMAYEMTNYTRNNILLQASTAMLAQANAAPQGVLSLLQ